MHPVLHAHEPGPFEVGRKIPTISKGFEAGPGHTETVVNFTPGCRGALQASGAVAGTATGVGTAGNGCWGHGRGRAQAWMLGSQPAQHPSCSRASGRHLPPASQIKAMQKDTGKIICPSSKQVQMLNLGISSNCKVLCWEATCSWHWEWRASLAWNSCKHCEYSGKH